MIYDGSIDVAMDAAERWASREGERAGREGLSAAEIETPDRIQKRLDRLAKSSMREHTGAASEMPIRDLVNSSVEAVGLERVLDEPDFRGIAFLQLALAVAKFVGRVVIRSSPTVGAGFGTGFMVSPRLLLTNNHVLRSPRQAQYSEVEFDYQYDPQRRLLPSVYFALEPNVFFMTDEKLDFTLVAVAERSRSGGRLNPYGWSRMIPAEGKVLLGEPLNIIQHPRGQPKQIVFRQNKLVDLLDHFAHYTTDTEPGSSGSPVYNDQWELVALHHSGVPRRDEQGRLLTKGGAVWVSGRDDPDDLDWVANEGIRISSLVRHIEKQNLPASQAALRRELLETEPPPIELDADAVAPPPPAPPSPPPPPPPESAPASGAVSITLPLTISISLGSPAGQSASASLSNIAVTRPEQADQQTLSVSGPQRSADLEMALAELEQAASRPYYDEAADRAARDAYWKHVDVGQQTPGTLFEVLRDTLERTHGRKLAYKPSLHVYPWVDLRPGPVPTVKSIYSGKGFDPRELIEADVAAEAERRRVAEVLAAAPGAMPFEAALESLETSLPYNCEHVVPQSWFAKKEPMRGDLHHLFTCESRCNSFRSNTPYYDFPDFEEAIRDDCGKSEHERFEPNAGKGEAARATLYFLLRYPGQINDAPGEYQKDRLETLLRWHKRYPPDLYEKHRNAAIQEKQGNRNPLIDFPDWADRIDFSRGLGGAASEQHERAVEEPSEQVFRDSI